MVILGAIIALGCLLALLYRVVEIHILYDIWEKGAQDGYIKETWYEFIEKRTGIKQIKKK